MRQTWLVTYYDGNENKVALLDTCELDENLINVFESIAIQNDWDITSIVELHHAHTDSNNADWSPVVFVNDEWHKIRELPMFGEEA